MFSFKPFTRPIQLTLAVAFLISFVLATPMKTSQAQKMDGQISSQLALAVKAESLPSLSLADEKSTYIDRNVSQIEVKAAANNKIQEIRNADDWQSWPILPELTGTAHIIYEQGQQAGRNPHAFSKIGDGEISAEWFLTEYDLSPGYYDLGDHLELQPTIAYFAGSLGRQGQAARRGFNTQSVLDPDRADPIFCQNGESPLDCEIRLHNSAFSLISMGTNQVWQPELFENGLRQIIEELLAQNVVPILSTKADNLEGDYRINRIISQLAVEYDLPVWNFWRAVQLLPNHGLQDDLEHLTYYPNSFSYPEAMQFAWPVRNLSALQLLDVLQKIVLL
jgi:hypothetical protein